MGRYSYSYRDKADELRNISISWLRNNGYNFRKGQYKYGSITWSNNYSEAKSSITTIFDFVDDKPCLTLRYTITKINDEVKKIEYDIKLVSTTCNFGGKRYWFECPIYKNGIYCGRRISKLYQSSDYFSCRHCGNLTYSSRFIPKDVGLGILHKMFDREDRIKKLEPLVKRKYYRGRETRKYRRLLYLMNEFDSRDAERIIQNGLYATKRISQKIKQ